MTSAMTLSLVKISFKKPLFLLEFKALYLTADVLKPWTLTKYKVIKEVFVESML